MQLHAGPFVRQETVMMQGTPFTGKINITVRLAKIAPRPVATNLLRIFLVDRVRLCRHNEVVFVQILDLVCPPGNGDLAPLGG